MLATLAFLSALSALPAQEGQLRLTNERPTYGIMGAPRPATDKYLPGDAYFLTFDIENLKVDDTGKVIYTMSMELLDSKNKPQFKSEPQKLEMTSSLGGNRVPAFAHAILSTDTAEGEYTLHLTVEDRATQKKAELTRKFDVVKKDFGLVRVNTSYDGEGRLPAPAVAVAGQSLWVNFAAVGYDRDKKTKQPDIAVEMRVLDENGKPTVEKPFPGSVSDNVPENWSLVPMQFMLTLNRPGKFTVELKATDKVANKKSPTLKFPVTVLDR
jgi:hypothetical protein